jgi:CRP-like cAMP-binding protein
MHFQNRILAALPLQELARLESALQRVKLEPQQILFSPWEPIDHVWFPEDALVSVLSEVAEGAAVESAVVGRDGMVGLPRFHGVESAAERGVVQVRGAASRIRADEFATLVRELPALRAELHRYSAALFTMAAQSSGCNRRHSVEQRCARWLLTVHDRVGRDQFDVTQQVLAEMLGVRRATVSVAAAEMQRQGMIRYSRGRLTIVRREELETVSCGCYRVVHTTFSRLFDGGAKAKLSEAASA